MAVTTSTTIYGTPPVLEAKKQISSNIRKRERYGFAYPLTSNIYAGYFLKASGKSLIRNNLMQLLKTDLGERILLPGYGINLKKYLFQPMDEILFEAIKNEILNAIAKYASNIKVLKLGVYPLDDYGVEGLQAIHIKLSVQIIEEDTTFEVGVKIG